MIDQPSRGIGAGDTLLPYDVQVLLVIQRGDAR